MRKTDTIPVEGKNPVKGTNPEEGKNPGDSEDPTETNPGENTPDITELTDMKSSEPKGTKRLDPRPSTQGLTKSSGLRPTNSMTIAISTTVSE